MSKKCSFPKKSIYTWNGLKNEVIITKNVQQMEKLNKYRYRDRTTRVVNVAQVLYTTNR